MAYVVPRPNGSWELRMSRSTPSGPRSRTLASFRELSPAQAERAAERSGHALNAAEALELARRAGAPTSRSAAEAAAGHLASALARGERVNPSLARVIRSALGDPGSASASEQAAARWVETSLEERGRALTELLDLADATGRSRPAAPLAFPRLAAGAG